MTDETFGGYTLDEWAMWWGSEDLTPPNWTDDDLAELNHDLITKVEALVAERDLAHRQADRRRRTSDYYKEKLSDVTADRNALAAENADLRKHLLCHPDCSCDWSAGPAPYCDYDRACPFHGESVVVAFPGDTEEETDE